MLITNVQTLEELEDWIATKLKAHNVNDTLDNRLSFLEGARRGLEEIRQDAVTFRVKNLVDSEIAVLRVRKHVPPMLF